MLLTNKLLHHNSLNSPFVNEFPAVLPNNYSAWGTWWTVRYQINLGIFLNSQGYLKAIKLHATKEAWVSPGSCRARQEDVVHLFSYDICLFQIKFTEASTSVLYHIPTAQKIALQMSSFFPVDTFSETPFSIPQEPTVSKVQVPGLKATLEANRRIPSLQRKEQLSVWL